MSWIDVYLPPDRVDWLRVELSKAEGLLDKLCQTSTQVSNADVREKVDSFCHKNKTRIDNIRSELEDGLSLPEPKGAIAFIDPSAYEFIVAAERALSARIIELPALRIRIRELHKEVLQQIKQKSIGHMGGCPRGKERWYTPAGLFLVQIALKTSLGSTLGREHLCETAKGLSDGGITPFGYLVSPDGQVTIVDPSGQHPPQTITKDVLKNLKRKVGKPAPKQGKAAGENAAKCPHCGDEVSGWQCPECGTISIECKECHVQIRHGKIYQEEVYGEDYSDGLNIPRR